MAKEMLINVSEGEECRIALVEKGRLEELYMERTSATSHVGNIYKGRVTNVEPSIQAAFIDFGLGRNGFLHISDLMPSYFGRKNDDFQESVGRKMARRDRPPIQRCLHRGDEIIVQIIKEGIGTKGPTLSTYLSVPGRILVMMPGMTKLGVSRKIEDEEERRRLRQILDGLKPPKDCGFIIRTAGVGKTKAEIQKDLQYLTRLWQNVQKKIASGPGPMELYTEGDLVTRTVRDVFTADIERIVIDNEAVARRVKDFIKIAMPRTKNKVELHEEPVPLFHKYGIEREIEQMYSRTVPLPSGGSLIIDSTEAVVAIDVNSGKFRDQSDAEMTAFKTDLEAADEIPRQLRLRDLGGVIICDFIDLRYERHRRELEKKLHDNLRDDRAKTKMLRMSQFGIIEMTRQRMRPSLKRSIYFDCPHCKGAGLVKTPESMALDVMRRLAIAINDQRVARIELAVSPAVDFYLQNRKRAALAELEVNYGKRILIRSDAQMGADEVNLQLFDQREGLVFLDSLGMVPPSAQPMHGGQPRGQQRPDHRDRRDQRRPQDRGRRDQGMRPRREVEEREEQFDIETVEETVNRRDVELAEQAAKNGDAIAPSPAPVEASDVMQPAEGIEEEPEAASAIEEAAEAVPVASGGAAPRADHQQQGRRRGRRGRSRGRGDETFVERTRGPEAQVAPEAVAERPAPASAPAAVEPEPVPEPVVAVQTGTEAGAGAGAEVTEEAAPKKARTRRGSRGRGRRGKKAAAEAAPTGAVGVSSAPQVPVPAGTAAARAAADKHLVHDEPVFPQPVHRPRTYRDLDAIPDDFD